jgi:hypothetical protein
MIRSEIGKRDGLQKKRKFISFHRGRKGIMQEFEMDMYMQNAKLLSSFGDFTGKLLFVFHVSKLILSRVIL